MFAQIDKIMSSIGAGINSGLDVKDHNSGTTHTTTEKLRKRKKCDDVAHSEDQAARCSVEKKQFFVSFSTISGKNV